MRQSYPGVTADLIRHLLANDRPQAFAARVGALQNRIYREIAGRDNDVRVAGNFALLGAAFEEMADYFGDVWPGAVEAKQQFVKKICGACATPRLMTSRQKTNLAFF